MIIRQTKLMGRGIFSTKNYKKGNIITICPVILIPKNEISKANLLNLYVYYWDKNYDALSLGLGSLFNHKLKSNVEFYRHESDDYLVFIAKRNIKKGEQLFINYGYNPKIAERKYKELKE